MFLLLCLGFSLLFAGLYGLANNTAGAEKAIAAGVGILLVCIPAHLKEPRTR